MNKYFDDKLKTISHSIDSIQLTVFDDLLAQSQDIVKNGGKLIFSGLGKNVPICEKIVGMLNSLGIPANFLHTNTAMHGDLGMIQDTDLIVVLSKSGNTDESVLLLDYLQKNKGADVWGFTFNSKSKMAQILPDHCLLLELDNEGDKWDIVPNNSSSVYLIVLQGFALQLADRMGITLADFKVNHPGGAIGEKLHG